MNFDGYDLCFGGSGGSVPVVSLVPVVPFRWFRWLRWFRWFRSGGFVPLFLVLPHAGYDRLYKCRPILSNILQNVQRAYYPGKDISIDEGMIAFKGRLKFRQYMPAKPTKYGIKVWMAADAANGYVLNFEVYEGSQEGNLLIHGLGYDVVMKMARPFVNRKHHLFFDNFFSTPRLFEHLLDQGTFACATIRSNRKELPRCAK